jgi:integrase
MFVSSNGYIYFKRYCSDGRAAVSLGIKYEHKGSINKDLLKMSDQLLLNRIQDKVVKFTESSERLQEPVTKNQLEGIVNECLGKKKYNLGFILDWQEMLKKMESGELRQEKNNKAYSPSTIETSTKALLTLKTFAEKEKMQLSYKFDMAQRDNYVRWLMENKYSNNSINTKINMLRSFLKYSKKAGKHNNLTYKDDGFHFPSEITDAIVLTPEEIKAVYSLKLKVAQDKARDFALLGCFMGLRRGDLLQINTYIIRGNIIEILTGKTDEKVIIPLHPIVLEIHTKYNGQLPTFYETFLNYHLPNIFKLAADQCKSLLEKHLITMTTGGIKTGTYYEKWNLVSPHTLRRTCFTNMRKAGIHEEDIIKISGHSTVASLRRYLRITKEESAERLATHPFFTTPL